MHFIVGIAKMILRIPSALNQYFHLKSKVRLIATMANPTSIRARPHKFKTSACFWPNKQTSDATKDIYFIQLKKIQLVAQEKLFILMAKCVSG